MLIFVSSSCRESGITLAASLITTGNAVAFYIGIGPLAMSVVDASERTIAVNVNGLKRRALSFLSHRRGRLSTPIVRFACELTDSLCMRKTIVSRSQLSIIVFNVRPQRHDES